MELILLESLAALLLGIGIVWWTMAPSRREEEDDEEDEEDDEPTPR